MSSTSIARKCFPKKILSVFSILFLMTYNVSCKNATCKTWKYRSGYRISDVIPLVYYTGVLKTGDTIFIHEKPVGIFLTVNDRVYPLDDLLLIKSLEGERVGMYVCK